MPEFAVSDVLQVKNYCKLGDQVSVNVQHYLVTSVSADATLAGVAQSIKGIWDDDILNLLPNTALYQGTGVRRMTNVMSLEALSGGGSIAGLAAAPSLPRQDALLVSFYTSVPGPSGRGRIYLPFISVDGLQNDGTVDPTFLTHAEDLAAATRTVTVLGATGFVLRLIIWHPGDPTTKLVIRHVVRDKWSTQRRRGDYGRPNSGPF